MDKFCDEPNINYLIDHYLKALESTPFAGNAIESIFNEGNAQKFIREQFKSERKNSKIKACIDLITPFRAKHTVSTYLLGLSIRNELHIDTRKWRRLPNESSSIGSFNLFWSWVCLFHDIGYKYEERPKEYAACKDIDDLMQKLGIEHNFLQNSSNAELIRNYYRYRINGKTPKVDHGIVGAILLYDALLDLHNSDASYSDIKQFPSFLAKICDTIAVHNMWRATPKTTAEYLRYHLNELVPSSDNAHMVYYRDNPFLFLLGVVDSIDPIKYFCNDRRHSNPRTPQDVLSSVFIDYEYSTSAKKLTLGSEAIDIQPFANELAKENEGLESWLGVSVTEKPEEKKVVLCVDTKSKRTKRIGLNLSAADLREANLHDANLSKADLSRANMCKADLSEADLSGANMCEADLSEADLSGVNMCEADLSEASLYGANLRGADLSGANMYKADLRAVNLLGTILPDGFKSNDQEELITHLESLNIGVLVDTEDEELTFDEDEFKDLMGF